MIKEIDGINVNYEIKGQGDYVFLLHGWGSNLGLFSAVADIISQKYTVVSFDFPGFGQTPEPPEVWDVSKYAEFTSKFISSFGCGEVILLGHSFGGRVILKLTEIESLPFRMKMVILLTVQGLCPCAAKSRISEQGFIKSAKKY